MKKLRHIVLAFAVLSACSNLLAQESNDSNTLFGDFAPNSIGKLGFFVAPTYGISAFDQRSASLFNLRGGLIINDKISFGGYFTSSLNQIKPESETIQNIYMDYWSIGGFVEYTLFPKKVLHLTFPLFLGYGEVEMDSENGVTGLGEANFFQIEPSALLEINLHQFIRFNVGAGYRFVGPMNYRNINQNDMTGLTGYLGFKFGRF